MIVGAGIASGPEGGRAGENVVLWVIGDLITMGGVFSGSCAPAMAASGGGSIVNNASTAGVNGDPMVAAYSAAKHGVVGLTRSAALDVAREGIRVNALVTGLVDTPLWREVARDPEAKKYFLDRMPVGRAGKEEEVAAFVAFLLGDEAAFITGAALSIDGGLTAG
ncbi:SDR family NAD(P)-dependent oxidoreductase [Sphaerisporangium aureirubrum]|uniref:SDR family NAD(P)-dependent oxidoreductase n=1 Tax=Sphaerisporangium aureirubrum TaxID=1544736 RepID=A0ABW1NF33_9ACTN